jgi:hypothetical protein
MNATLMEDTTSGKFRLFIIVSIVACIIATGCAGTRPMKGLKKIAIAEVPLASN